MGKLAINDDLLARLDKLAASKGKKPEQVVEDLLRDVFESRAERDELYKAVSRVAALTPRGVPQTDSTDLLREDRDR